MPEGLNRAGNFKSGVPIPAAAAFKSNPVTWPTPDPKHFGNANSQAPSPKNFGNTVNWVPAPNHFGNPIP